MQGGEIRQLRDKLGLPLRDAAALLHVWPARLAAMEDGTRPVSRGVERAVRLHQAVYREAELDAAGELPVCPAVEVLQRAFLLGLISRNGAGAAGALRRHQQECAVCAHRAEMLEPRLAELSPA